MEITANVFLSDARAKLDLLAMAVDYAAAGINAKSPHSCPNVKAADQKLQDLLAWYDSVERSGRQSIPADEAEMLFEYLDREIAGAQNLLGAVSQTTPDKVWWHNLLLVMAIIAATAAIKVWFF